MRTLRSFVIVSGQCPQAIGAMVAEYERDHGACTHAAFQLCGEYADRFGPALAVLADQLVSPCDAEDPAYLLVDQVSPPVRAADLGYLEWAHIPYECVVGNRALFLKRGASAPVETHVFVKLQKIGACRPAPPPEAQS